MDQISGQVAAKLRLAPAEVVNACKWGTWRNLSLSRASIQLGQLSVIPPGLVLEAGGDFNLAGSYACKVEVPPTSRFQVGGDFSSPGMAAC